MIIFLLTGDVALLLGVRALAKQLPQTGKQIPAVECVRILNEIRMTGFRPGAMEFVFDRGRRPTCEMAEYNERCLELNGGASCTEAGNGTGITYTTTSGAKTKRVRDGALLFRIANKTF